MVAELWSRLFEWLHVVFVQQFDLWVLFGFIAQVMFMARFLVQWIASERARRSVVPTAFWFFSIAGGLLLLIYAIYREDPVFILGQAAGLFIYVRNITLIRRERRTAGEVATGAPQ
jgi:lipid-A-disaccharide synthase-like uncharacterized protein